MLRGSIVISPDGARWRVGRRWMDRPLPSLRRRFRENSEGALNESGFEALGALEMADSPGAAVALAVGSLLLVVVLLPLLGIAVELILLMVLLWSGISGRVFLGRPWIVEAVDLDDAKRSEASR